MERKIDFQGLLNVMKAAEREPYLYMRYWKLFGTMPNCGTSHCMIGAFCNENAHDDLFLYGHTYTPTLRSDPNKDFFHAIAARFGISVRESQFLFGEHYNGRLCVKIEHAANLTKPQALARLRKYIYYKLHKAEMTLEEARHIDGNKAVVRSSQECHEDPTGVVTGVVESFAKSMA